MQVLEIIKAYRSELVKLTATQVVIAPSELESEKFHVTLSVLPHPHVVENGRIHIRLRGTIEAAIPASDRAIEDCLKKSISLARFFGDAQGFPISPPNFYGMAYHKALREDDDIFADLTESRGYVYAESWLIELDFDELILEKT